MIQGVIEYEANNPEWDHCTCVPLILLVRTDETTICKFGGYPVMAIRSDPMRFGMALIDKDNKGTHMQFEEKIVLEQNRYDTRVIDSKTDRDV